MMRINRLALKLEDETGGAMVEFVISMLVIVPVFLYGMLIQDIFLGVLDLQETVAGAGWDFSQYYKLDPNAAHTGVAGFNRLTWCNHTTMYDSFSQAYDCNAEDHHAELGAHICWLGPGAQQVQCRKDGRAGRFGVSLTDPFNLAGAFFDEFNEGGLFSCTASISFLNRLVPGTFFTQWTEVELAPTEKHELDVKVDTGAGGMVECDPHTDEDCQSVHVSAQEAGAGQAVTLREATFAVLGDTWHIPRDTGARVGSREYSPGESESGVDSLYDRVEFLYTSNLAYPFFVISALQFFQKAIMDEELISPLHFQTPWVSVAGDNPMWPNISEQHADVGAARLKPERIRQPNGIVEYFTTSWGETSAGEIFDDRYKDTWEERGRYYMGKKESPKR